MTKAYIAQIDELIEQLQDEIDGLISAKKIVMTLMDERPKAGSGQVSAHSVKTYETGRKWVLQPVPKGKGKHSKVRGTGERGVYQKHILEILSGFTGYATSASIIDTLEQRGVPVPKKQRVWAALADMKKRGMILHDKDTGTYAKTFSDPQVEQEIAP